MNRILPGWLLIGALFISVTLSAQVTISTIVPVQPQNVNDLWSLTLTNSSTGAEHFFLTMDLADNSGNILVKQKSSEFSINGVVSINGQDLSTLKPIQTVFSSPLFISNYNRSYNSFPAGSYTVLFKVYNASNPSANEYLADGQYQFENFSNRNLLLQFPLNESVINEFLPVLKWELMGSMVESGCEFELLVKEVFQGQSATDAMLYNQVYVKAYSSEAYYPYKLSDRQLMVGKTYAWMTKYKCGEKELLVSEIWTFTIKDNLAVKKTYFNPNSFYKLKDFNTDGTEVLVDDNYLKLKYTTTFIDSDGLLSYVVINDKDKQVFSNSEIPLTVKMGDNRYVIGLCSHTGYALRPGRYKIVVTNDQTKRYSLHFIVKPKNTCE